MGAAGDGGAERDGEPGLPLGACQAGRLWKTRRAYAAHVGRHGERGTFTGMYRTWTFVAALTALPPFVGCAAAEPHRWQVEGDDRAVTLDTSSWTRVPATRFASVTEEHIAETERLLSGAEWSSVTAEQAAAWTGEAAPSDTEGRSPYLLRAVAGGRPMFSTLRVDPVSGCVVVHRGTWNGENWFVYRGMAYGPWPLVAWLSAAPTRVLSTATIGGDWIFYGREGADVRWERHARSRE